MGRGSTCKFSFHLILKQRRLKLAKMLNNQAASLFDVLKKSELSDFGLCLFIVHYCMSHCSIFNKALTNEVKIQLDKMLEGFLSKETSTKDNIFNSLEQYWLIFRDFSFSLYSECIAF